jgi:hypothetical protein
MSKKKDRANGTTKVRERVERARYDKVLAVPATDEEVSVAAVGMVGQIRKREAVLEERRTSMAGFRDTLAAIDDRLGELADTVEGHTKRLSVACIEYLCVETSTIEVVRLDTSEIVETRAAEAEDLQENLLPRSGEAATEGM